MNNLLNLLPILIYLLGLSSFIIGAFIISVPLGMFVLGGCLLLTAFILVVEKDRNEGD